MSEASVGFEKPRYLSKSKQELRWIAMATTAPRVFKLKSVELEIAEHCQRIANLYKNFIFCRGSFMRDNSHDLMLFIYYLLVII